MAWIDPQQVYATLIQRGASPAHALGILANIQAESSFNPTAIGDSGTSGGLFQHHGPRFDALRSYAGGNWQDPMQQIAYAFTEPDMQKFLAQPYDDWRSASQAFTKNFERPANAAQKAVDRVINFSPEDLGLTPEAMAQGIQFTGDNPMQDPMAGYPQFPQQQAPVRRGLLEEDPILGMAPIQMIGLLQMSGVPPSQAMATVMGGLLGGGAGGGGMNPMQQWTMQRQAWQDQQGATQSATERQQAQRMAAAYGLPNPEGFSTINQVNQTLNAKKDTGPDTVVQVPALIQDENGQWRAISTGSVGTKAQQGVLSDEIVKFQDTMKTWNSVSSIMDENPEMFGTAGNALGAVGAVVGVGADLAKKVGLDYISKKLAAGQEAIMPAEIEKGRAKLGLIKMQLVAPMMNQPGSRISDMDIERWDKAISILSDKTTSGRKARAEWEVITDIMNRAAETKAKLLGLDYVPGKMYPKTQGQEEFSIDDLAQGQEEFSIDDLVQGREEVSIDDLVDEILWFEEKNGNP